jgi:Lar family restriction alleviation protein
MKIEIIKRCPFCGGEATNYAYDSYDGYQGDCTRYRVKCRGCGAMIEDRTAEKAIAAWNKRTVQKVQKI